MLPNWKRRLIPKWRDSKITAKLPEALPIVKKYGRVYNFLSGDNQQNIKILTEEWRNNKSLGGAANLLSFGHVTKLHPLLVEPAQYIVDRSQHVPQHLCKFAQVIIGKNVDKISPQLIVEQTQQFYHYASLLKQRLLTNPRDAITLVDLARIYSSLGQNNKAKRAIITAVSLYPDHRFILRSASRFFIHNDETERALYILNQSERTKHDPWLMATHISISTILERPQKLIRKVKTLIKLGNMNPIHMSELCGSLGTVQMIDGNNKEARRNFNKALTLPNDNTVAQAVWMAQYYDLTITTKKDWFLDPISSEARYYQCDLLGDFEAALIAALEWHLDEPFSSYPAIAAVYTASILEKYEDAEKYARSALQLHHNDTNLKGNLVFTLAAQNKIELAESLLLEVIHIERQQDGDISPQSIANLGMLMYRTGDFVEGEKLYRAAIEWYGKKQDFFRKSIAMAFLAKEATLANAPNADNLKKEAMDILKQSHSKSAEKILASFNCINLMNNKLPLIKPTKWRYDKDRNLIILPNRLPFSER